VNNYLYHPILFLSEKTPVFYTFYSMPKYLFLLIVLAACSGEPRENKRDAAAVKKQTDSVRVKMVATVPVNDTLNAIAGLIAGSLDTTTIFSEVAESPDYIAFRQHFSKRWKAFDSARVARLSDFRHKQLDKDVKPEPTLFYPFSGPDILHAALFFPNANQYVLVGLEPVGTLPRFNAEQADSLEHYYNTLNTSLDAILNFSFFRTESMRNDLRNTEVNGTLHLLFLFLNRTGNAIVSAKPITVDSAGNRIDVASFDALRNARLKTKGAAIQFLTPDKRLKELLYFSVNAADYNLSNNTGFVNYLNGLQHFNVYLKGASYLLHKPTFKIVRNLVLKGATTIIQDDSGIALKYFENDTLHTWTFNLYGQYSKPIQMFAKHYQPLLDSLYRQQGATQLDFGLGYNYRDKNSNFMVITKKN
jgi:hypothetical protein